MTYLNVVPHQVEIIYITITLPFLAFVTNSASSWFINSAGSATIPVVNSTTANIGTANITTLNVSGTTSTSKLSIGSSMRAGTDIMNIALSNNGSYIISMIPQHWELLMVNKYVCSR